MVLFPNLYRPGLKGLSTHLKLNTHTHPHPHPHTGPGSKVSRSTLRWNYFDGIAEAAGSHMAVLPACLHPLFLPAPPARRGIAVIVQDPITVGAKQTQNKELLMSLFLLTMQQLLGQLINARWSRQQSSICTNCLFFHPFPLLSPTEAALREIASISKGATVFHLPLSTLAPSDAPLPGYH